MLRNRADADASPFVTSFDPFPLSQQGQGAQSQRPSLSRSSTERVVAPTQAATQEAERARLALEAAGIGTWDFNPITGALAWSDRTRLVFGLPGATPLDYQTFLEGIHPDDRARVDRNVQDALDPLGGGRIDVEYRTRWPDGAVRWVIAKGRTTFDEIGGERRPVRCIGTIIDVTDRRRAEDYSRLLAEASTLLASSLDVEVMLAGVARLACQRLADAVVVDLADETGAVTRATAVDRDGRRAELMRRARELLPTVGEWNDAHPIARALRQQRTVRLESVSVTDRDRMAQSEAHRAALQQLGVSSLVVVPLVARGHALGAITFVRTVTRPGYDEGEQAVAEELAQRTATAIENAQLYRAAVAASEAKSHFLASMSHELRTPLTAIIGYEELLADGITGPVTDTQRHQLGRIKASASHLLGLIDEILTYSRMEAGSERAHIESVRVRDALDEAAAIICPLVDDRGLKLEIERPSCVEQRLQTDPQKLRQILVNLLSNAAKFTEHGTVTLGARREGRQMLFFVRDTGIGISDENQARIFEPFWQVDQRATRRVMGTGLGLTVSRRLAQMLGGDVDVESEPGKGSTFTLQLPAEA
ncbi:MAG TPA: ATP-binding protein [Gemmatimonadaceae bacterium]|nr:ATP-binding protein [Gemmatimonadaceae bacterium]